MRLQWKKHGSRILLENVLYSVVEEVHSHPAIESPVPFWTIHSREWVNVIAIDTDSARDPKARMLWVRQYRTGSEKVTWETPGGACDADDASPLLAAQRELLEESGATAKDWLYLGSLSPNAALFKNKVHTFLALGCVIDERATLGDGHEVIEPEWAPFGERFEKILNGDVDHALVAASFTLLDARLARGENL